MERYLEFPIENGSFEHNGETYDCRFAIERDIKQIIQEAETSHKESFDKDYNRDSLSPNKIRVYLDENGNPLFGMVLYLIDYKSKNCQRWACGNYCPFWANLLSPFPYQGSICW